MKYLLDTNICSYIIKHRPIEVLHKFNRLEKSNCMISSITVAEMKYWVAKQRKLHERSQNKGDPKTNETVINEFIKRLNVVDFDAEAGDKYGELRIELELKGTIIGNMDLLIGAHAVSLKAILVTNNIREFKRIPGLKIENWVNEK